MRKFILLLVIIVNGVLSTPFFIDELESEPRVFAQRGSNTNRMLQAGEHVHALDEERRLVVGFKAEALGHLKAKVKLPISRIKN
ncbi:RxLR-like protein [Plasmopara halstedii]|uniref:RxLR-like protein n=1 Tax=Plasmopara halstedii TaxID=4781 RepID=A0A0N7L6N6_PLAHL|nr:RxLR-like protein [Plasmopara halstedii]CEG44779.1 RxLR-like protein [Plasmopara halstedii]|eukprot:XP_024581148.1 RxLR-like protein [Plasmopara halstedii]